MKAIRNIDNETFVKFSENGVNQLVKLRIMNVQPTETSQVWNEVSVVIVLFNCFLNSCLKKRKQV